MKNFRNAMTLHKRVKYDLREQFEEEDEYASIEN